MRKQSLEDVFEMLVMAIKLGVDKAYEVPLKDYGTWIISVRKDSQ